VWAYSAAFDIALSATSRLLTHVQSLQCCVSDSVTAIVVVYVAFGIFCWSVPSIVYFVLLLIIDYLRTSWLLTDQSCSSAFSLGFWSLSVAALHQGAPGQMTWLEDPLPWLMTWLKNPLRWLHLPIALRQ